MVVTVCCEPQLGYMFHNNEILGLSAMRQAVNVIRVLLNNWRKYGILHL